MGLEMAGIKHSIWEPGCTVVLEGEPQHAGMGLCQAGAVDPPALLPAGPAETGDVGCLSVFAFRGAATVLSRLENGGEWCGGLEPALL